jgi:hypothetical protein
MLRSVPTGISCFRGTMAVIDYRARASHKLDMAALLDGFDKTGRL